MAVTSFINPEKQPVYVRSFAVQKLSAAAPAASASSTATTAGGSRSGFGALLREECHDAWVAQRVCAVERRAAVAAWRINIDAELDNQLHRLQRQRFILAAGSIHPRLARADSRRSQQGRRGLRALLLPEPLLRHPARMMHELRIRAVLNQHPHHVGLIETSRQPERRRTDQRRIEIPVI